MNQRRSLNKREGKKREENRAVRSFDMQVLVYVDMILVLDMLNLDWL